MKNNLLKIYQASNNDSVLIGRILQLSYENEKKFIRSVSETLTSNCFLFDDKGNFCCKRSLKIEIFIFMKIIHKYVYLCREIKVL